jgi:hypothetical protein
MREVREILFLFGEGLRKNIVLVVASQMIQFIARSSHAKRSG